MCVIEAIIQKTEIYYNRTAMPNFSNRTQLALEGVIGILFILIGLLAFYLFLKPVDPLQRTFKSPHGTVTYSERGGVGPQTSRDILLADKYGKADLATDKKAQQFIINQSRQTDTIFIDKNCLISPISIAWSMTNPLTFTNEDTSPHMIVLLSHTYTIAPGKDFIVPDTIPTDTIIKVYCDQEKKLQGYIYFTK